MKSYRQKDADKERQHLKNGNRESGCDGNSKSTQDNRPKKHRCVTRDMKAFHWKIIKNTKNNQKEKQEKKEKDEKEEEEEEKERDKFQISSRAKI